MQRALAAKSVAQAQTGLMVGGRLILHGRNYNCARHSPYGILETVYRTRPRLPIFKPFTRWCERYYSCGLFASLMSTVDSTFNSIATYGLLISMLYTST